MVGWWVGGWVGGRGRVLGTVPLSSSSRPLQQPVAEGVSPLPSSSTPGPPPCPCHSPPPPHPPSPPTPHLQQAKAAALSTPHLKTPPCPSSSASPPPPPKTPPPPSHLQQAKGGGAQEIQVLPRHLNQRAIPQAIHQQPAHPAARLDHNLVADGAGGEADVVDDGGGGAGALEGVKHAAAGVDAAHAVLWGGGGGLGGGGGGEGGRGY